MTEGEGKCTRCMLLFGGRQARPVMNERTLDLSAILMYFNSRNDEKSAFQK